MLKQLVKWLKYAIVLPPQLCEGFSGIPTQKRAPETHRSSFFSIDRSTGRSGAVRHLQYVRYAKYRHYQNFPS